jgi:NTE family protein
MWRTRLQTASFVIRCRPDGLNETDRSGLSIALSLAGMTARGVFGRPDTSMGPPPRIGLALGGGFARGIAHIGVLRIFERHGIPIHCITGVSAGSIVAAAYASGAHPDEIARAACAMRFSDVARWSLNRTGFVVSKRMTPFLQRLLKHHRFEEMPIPLGVVATDLCTGEPVSFRATGDVFLPIRASCSYPGLFQPVRSDGGVLVDGAMSIGVPALLARELGATHVVSVHLPAPPCERPPSDVFQVIRRCFQIMQIRTESGWRQASDLVITPDLGEIAWDGFECGPKLVSAGEAAALAVLPRIESWFSGVPCQRSEGRDPGLSTLLPTGSASPEPA